MERKKYWSKNCKTRADRIKLKRKLVDLLGGQCIDCGYSAHLAALDFDHVDPKTKKFMIGEELGNPYRYYDLLEEIKKCVIRCANCHRIKTHPEYIEDNVE